jgi:hypothetical protein
MRFGGEAYPPAFNDDAAQSKAVLAKSMSTMRNATSSRRLDHPHPTIAMRFPGTGSRAKTSIR